MNQQAIWITGPTRSGKTSRLTSCFVDWLASRSESAGVLVLAAIGDNRLDLADRLTVATGGQQSFRSTTPLGFFEDEVNLFWSLLIEQLDLKAQFPLRLAPESEQELATQFWQPELDEVIAQQSGAIATRLVRRILDLLQLAALAGISLTEVPVMLVEGLGEQPEALPIAPDVIGTMLERWQRWCLERGLLTYGIIASLYRQYLLPHPTYRQHLSQRYQFLLADDVDEYPAIARDLFEVLLDDGATALFTFNPEGAVRLGLGADPNYLAALATRCQVETLDQQPVSSLVADMGAMVIELVTDPIWFASLPDSCHVIQTTSRAQLLRQMADVIVTAVRANAIQPHEVAVIGPGLDAIARYTLSDCFNQHQMRVESLNDQRPLTSFPIIRALLTLLTLVYPGLGRLVDREAVAEMLVILSGNRGQVALGESASPETAFSLYPTAFVIDPVRAGLLADYCFAPHPDRPRLLPPTTFPRWDRLGYQAAGAYGEIVRWLETQQSQLEQRLIPNAVALLDRAIQHFLLGGGNLPFDQLAALRQLLETAQRYWEVSGRLRQGDRHETPAYMTVSRLIQLLRSGAVTANPYPVRPIGPASNAVTLATVFQYRSSRRHHRWQFWLDAGSPRWLTGVDALYAAPLFLHEWSGRPITAVDTMAANERRLRRILLDLLGRTSERVYLCHSELATNGQEQTGVLLSLVNAATPLGA